MTNSVRRIHLLLISGVIIAHMAPSGQASPILLKRAKWADMKASARW